MKLSPVTLLSVSAFLVSASVYIVNPIIAIYVRQYLGATFSEVGVVVSTAFIASFILKIPLGIALTGRNLYGSTIVSVLIMTTMPAAYALSNNVSTILVLRVIHGIGFALVWSLLWTEISVVGTGAKTTSHVARFALISSLGIVTGPLVSAAVTGILGPRATLLVDTALTAPAILLVAMLPRNLTQTVREEDTETANRLRKMFSTVLSQPGVYLPVLGTVSYSFVFGVALAYAPIYAYQHFGLSESEAASLFVGFTVMAVATRVIFNKVVAKLSLPSIISISLLNVGAMMIFMALSENVLIFAFCFGLMGFTQGMILPTNALFVARSVDSSKRVLANTVTQAAWDLGILLGPLFGSALVPQIGIPLVIAFSAVIPLVNSIIVKIASKRANYAAV
ncbi:MAG: MFS transporter [Thaumarchaeota archaeon]|nr:MFS transporter [Nitrososphaerota archaeon]